VPERAPIGRRGHGSRGHDGHREERRGGGDDEARACATMHGSSSLLLPASPDRASL